MFLFYFILFQVIYLAIIGATYYYIVKSSFRYIPGYYLGEVHKYVQSHGCNSYAAEQSL